MFVKVSFYFCTLALVLPLLCRHNVLAECHKRKVTVYDMCYTETYGIVFSSLTSYDKYTCAQYCIQNTSCLSTVYDESNGLCSLNSVFLLNPPTCHLNVKYIQIGEYQCERNGDMEVCGLNIYSTPGSIQGYILININGVWGTVCDDFWEESNYGASNAAVFCKSFGYSGGQTVYPLGSYNHFTDSTPILIDDLKCVGTESHINYCAKLGSQHNCGHYEDVRVICS